MSRIAVPVLAALGLLTACAQPGMTPSPAPSPSPGDGVVELDFDFRDGDQGWQAGISDFTAQVEPGDPESGIAELPPGAPDDEEGPAFVIAATNHPDDLFMFLKRSVGENEGLRRETDYDVSYRITFLSDAPSDCAGIGGAPGESVHMKAGATTEEPIVVEQDDGFRLNVDKGNQAADGPAATVMGDVANGIPCDEALDQQPPPFAQVVHEHSHEPAVATGGAGRLWLLVGTDSGFEGRTTLYYQRIEVTLSPVE